MKLKSISIRFYKSFNHDHTRKLSLLDPNENIFPEPWEFINETFYPHVKVSVDSQITTIVGANESGKSHLLSAVEKARYGHLKEFEITREDFCRYSHFFDSVDENIPHYPDFGLEFHQLTPDEIEKLKKIYADTFKIDSEKIDDEQINFNCFHFFRQQDGIVIYLAKLENQKEEQPKLKSAKSAKAEEVTEPTVSETIKQKAEYRYAILELTEIPDDFLPPVFRIKSDVPLPGQVPIELLLKDKIKEAKENYSIFDKNKNTLKLIDNQSSIKSLLQKIISNPQGQMVFDSNELTKAQDIIDELEKIDPSVSEKESIQAIKGFNLVYDLLYTICEINKEDIKQIKLGLDSGNPGMIRANQNKIDKALANKLRFESIWSQDKNFAINVTATEYNLQFSITDRTGCPYSFNERSGGLKHFLSYYIQYLTHQTPAKANSEILLMDEPDAYLSGDAQQDLLKIFKLFADPNLRGGNSSRKPIQVIYVTHSPFLIDKNHSERVRAVDKLEGNYGTRVIPGVTQNRYEPLRSAFGSHLGETVFMSQCNLMVEGPADQILIAGFANYLRNSDKSIPDSEILDLNKITIVPCGGADNVAYLTYLAIGKGTEKPAVVVLLDSDKQGISAREQLSKKGDHPNNKAVISDKFVLGLGDITRKDVGVASNTPEEAGQKPFVDLEDLVPVSLAIRIVQYFLSSFYKFDRARTSHITPEAVTKKHGELNQNGKPVSTFAALQAIVSEIQDERSVKIEKVPFAKTLIELLPEWTEASVNDQNLQADLKEFTLNMRAILKRLKQMQNLAEETAREVNQRKNVAQKVDLFLSDYQNQEHIIKDSVNTFLDLVKNVLEGSQEEQDFISSLINEIRRTHNLKENPNEEITNRELLFNQLERMKSAKKIIDEQRKVKLPTSDQQNASKTEVKITQ